MIKALTSYGAGLLIFCALFSTAHSACLPGLAECPVTPGPIQRVPEPESQWTTKRVLVGDDVPSVLAVVRYPRSIFDVDEADYSGGASQSTIGWNARTLDGSVTISIETTSSAGLVPSMDCTSSLTNLLQSFSDQKRLCAKRPDDFYLCREDSSDYQKGTTMYSIWEIYDDPKADPSQRACATFQLWFDIEVKDGANIAIVRAAERIRDTLVVPRQSDNGELK